jgi:hypothetical protein
MKIGLLINGTSHRHLIIEPWGEEFDIEAKQIEVIFTKSGNVTDCDIEIDCSEEGFLRIENPSGFRPKVLIDGQEDERPAFTLS